MYAINGTTPFMERYFGLGKNSKRHRGVGHQMLLTLKHCLKKVEMWKVQKQFKTFISQISVGETSNTGGLFTVIDDIIMEWFGLGETLKIT